MKIQNNNNSPHFQAVRIKPNIKYWNKDVLHSVLDSQYIKKLIINNEKMNKDTIIRNSSGHSSFGPGSFSINYMDLSVRTDNNNIQLMLESRNRYKNGFTEGPENLGEDLSAKIRNLDIKNNTKSIKEKLNELKAITSEVIIDPLESNKPGLLNQIINKFKK